MSNILGPPPMERLDQHEQACGLRNEREAPGAAGLAPDRPRAPSDATPLDGGFTTMDRLEPHTNRHRFVIGPDAAPRHVTDLAARVVGGRTLPIGHVPAWVGHISLCLTLSTIGGTIQPFEWRGRP